MTYLYISVLGLVHRNMVNSHQGLSRIACLEGITTGGENIVEPLL